MELQESTSPNQSTSDYGSRPMAEAFARLVRSRQSPREFLPTALDTVDIRAVLEDAQLAPSNSNTQPWHVHIVSGRTKNVLSRALVDAFERGQSSLDFAHGYGDGTYLSRSQEHGAALYKARGIERSDVEGRANVARDNLAFYGAPHVALLFMPLLGDGVRTAGDVGMYAQNFLLSLTARGFHGIPQTMIGMYADTVRNVLGISENWKLLFGISFGLGNEESALLSLDMGRVPLEESVVLHDTPGVLAPGGTED